MDAKLDAWSGQQSDPWTKVVAIAKAMRAGAYTDGGPPGNYQNVFLPGHWLARLPAVRAVRAARRRRRAVRRGARPRRQPHRHPGPRRLRCRPRRPSGEVKGSDIHAWVEVHRPTARGRRSCRATSCPTATSSPSSSSRLRGAEDRRPGPAAGRQQPAVASSRVPDQAQNATQNRKPPPKNPLDPSNWPDWVKWLLTYVGLPLLVLLLLYAVVRAVKARRRVRRRTRGPAGARIAGGWTEVVDTAADLGIGLPRNATRLEQAVSLDARVGDAYPFRPLAVRADAHVFAPSAPSLDEASAYWVEVKAARKVLRRQVPWWRRLLADVSPSSVRRPGGRQPVRRRSALRPRREPVTLAR